MKCNKGYIGPGQYVIISFNESTDVLYGKLANWRSTSDNGESLELLVHRVFTSLSKGLVSRRFWWNDNFIILHKSNYPLDQQDFHEILCDYPELLI